MKKTNAVNGKPPPGSFPGSEYRYFADGAWASDVKCLEAAGSSESKACVINVAAKRAA